MDKEKKLIDGLRGIIPSLHTPFCNQNKIDIPSLKNLIDHTISTGCSGMLVGAVAGDANVRFLQDFEGRNLVGIDATDPNGFDDVVVQELHLPVGREIIFKMRSQDVLHSAYMPFFRAQMNCVPGMITEFAFTPNITTEEMRQDSDIVAKVKKINKLRADKSKELIAEGDVALDPYEFDFLLLCNKICGASHYNMQMKIIVETPEEYAKWMAEQQTFAQVIQ